MAQVTQCSSSPTLTSATVSTSHSLSVTTTRTVSTVPGPVVTTTFSACSLINTNTTTCGLSTSVITGTGSVTTNEVVLTVTVDVPVSYQATFYGTSCSTLSRDSPVVTTPTPTPTPSPSIVTTSSVVTSDGSTYVTVLTSTETFSPTTPTSQSSSSSSSGTNIPVIVGGVLGGITALALLALLTWHLLKKKVSFSDDDFTTDTTTDPFQKNPAPDPYQYNPVTQQDTQAVGNSSSNGPAAQTFGNNNVGPFNGFTGNETGGQYGNGFNPPMGNDIGMQPGATGNDVMYNAPNQLPVHNLQNPSLAPLIVGGAAAAWQTRPNTTSSTTGSDFSGGPVMGYAPQQFPSYPPTTYAHQAYGPPQGGHPNNMGYTLNVGGVAPASTYSAASSSSNNGRTSGIDFVPMGMVQQSQYPQQQQQQQHVQMPQQQQQPYSQTASSNTSAQGNPPLQVRNPESDMSAQDSSGTYGTPGLTVMGSSSSTDGKGRPLSSQGEKAALVHLDGEAYQASNTPAPPAYME